MQVRTDRQATISLNEQETRMLIMILEGSNFEDVASRDNARVYDYRQFAIGLTQSLEGVEF